MRCRAADAPLIATLMLMGCGATPRRPPDPVDAVLRHTAAVVMRCEQPLVVEPATHDVREVCIETGPPDPEADVIGELAGQCARWERVRVPLTTHDAWRVSGCDREVVLTCQPICDGGWICLQTEEIGHIDFACEGADYERG